MQPYDEPRAISADRLLSAPVTALLVAGIVNPYGPTLTAVVAAAGESKTGTKLPVVQMMLNLLAKSCWPSGNALGEKWQPSEDIRRLFDLTSLRSCPSLLLPSVLSDEDRSVRLHAEFLRAFPDSRGVLKLVRQYFGNPWDRVLAEMRADDSIGGETVPLGEDEATELATLMLSEKHMASEIQAFFYAGRNPSRSLAQGSRQRP
jgi:hypothetical protein